MPIISRVGRSTLRVRLVYGVIYFLLGLGAVSMVYPLLLMVSGSVKSEADFRRATPVPEYLTDDGMLWRKYVESKYNNIPTAEKAFRRSIASWRKVEPPSREDAERSELVREYREFRETAWPDHWYTVGHTGYTVLLAKNARLFRKDLQGEYGGDIDAYSKRVGVHYNTWTQVGPPVTGMQIAEPTFKLAQPFLAQKYYAFKAGAPLEDRIAIDLDGFFMQTYLTTQWSSVESYNADHGTDYKDYREVLLTAEPPTADRSQERKDWEAFVRSGLSLAYIRIDPAAAVRFQGFLRKRYEGRIADLNAAWGKTAWGTPAEGFEEVRLPGGEIGKERVRIDVTEYLKDPAACPVELLSVRGPRQGFEEFLAKRRGVPVEQARGAGLPTELTDYADFLDHRGELKWEFVKRNYLAVIDYLLLHGHGIRNTAIFCTLLVMSSLVVNPLAAYSLSRYRPGSTYKILLFCMATMAFPTEVTMIPNYLLLKSFPLESLVVGVAAAAAGIFAVHKAAPGISERAKALTGIAAGVATGWWLAPWIGAHWLGRQDTGVSLLNTFWALILPTMANGFSIFLLKGFFDALPKELYEAAEIDGAGEWTKFWTITMSLSKPILAVIALGAFTAAYSAFMMALVIIPDQDMWTMMVWLFQLQTWAHPSVVYAGLVIAAVPTLMIFLFAQNLILRGMIVPTEK